MVLVQKQDGSYTEPCNNATARVLLKDNKAVVISYKPFTIKLNFDLDDLMKLLTSAKGVEDGE
jgi:hypothetical protein